MRIVARTFLQYRFDFLQRARKHLTSIVVHSVERLQLIVQFTQRAASLSIGLLILPCESGHRLAVDSCAL